MRLTVSLLSCMMVLAVSVAGIPTGQQSEVSVSTMAEELKTECTQKNDGLACIQYKLLNLIAQARSKDTFKVTEGVTVVKNNELSKKENYGRGFVDQLEDYVSTHDMLVSLPFTDTTLSVSPRNLDNNELSLSLRYPESASEDDAVEGKSRRRKNKLKKILVPIVAFVLLKALTLIPLAIGILGLKAWNALHLSFFSFVVSIGLAIFQLAKKITSDQQSAAVHAPWESYNQYAAARSFYEPDLAEQAANQDLDGQQMAYKAYSR